MMAKALVFEKRPFSSVHSIMTSQGFRLIGFKESVKYRVTMRDSSTESTYCLEIPVNPTPLEPNQAMLGRPSLDGGKRIPISVRDAAESKLYEIAEYVKNIMVKKDTLPHQTDESGSMVRDEAEMKQLGKEMESIKTKEELSKLGMTPDPSQ
ncbi:hypothetical protein [Neobacillus sp. FSL H8-0543]|uniref:hypothetical protein n=1 Tax=Neobacillus sp. FSL H8-0543 TaxID=2954672 RepID=UPI0031595DE7